ncbi:murein hydrolase activator EnvC family protein [Priestia megaterium]|jgi:peptidoglycan hydrolase CwlO-like protein|uniref:murein hydrolase activator EnvC family protein n=1 Tax=Priestia megaterium TaxID=1404 RepID=UPI0007C585CC|nr:M23 family metallopeptidase [Priestia megaterium]MDH6651919.1 peptidoglycan hydrolase CwlO-like protein [Bacillus sp. PvP124]MDP9578799.1 peptidoglycan hydrolase CwlO-like protein [Bacillus sp. 1751]MBD8113968.1 peptidoglycan DD-metalloendopeptidase family protein [Priestia megaterium]MBU8588037.1 peptidoglycan DD-metalloendopeptidase family protein [Priestia megaterium]MCI4620286.1 peptidoglycan DD-metalloendopeptidase family protein [Priestia megaterium]
MTRKTLVMTAAVLVGLSAAWIGNEKIAYAQSASTTKLSDLEKKSDDVNQNINQNKEKLKEVQEKQKNEEAEIARLDSEVGQTNADIRSRESEVEKAKQDIEKVKSEIDVVKKRIDKRNELLKKRARALQENGGSVDYIDVLLGSESFGDFISRVSAVSTIVGADRDLLMQHEADKKAKEEKETKVQNKLTEVNQALEELKNLRAQLQKQVDEKNQLMQTLKDQEKEFNEEAVGLEEQASILADQKNAAQAQQQEIEKAGATEEAPPATSGSFMRPAKGPVTSHFGYRETFGRGHYGIDIGKRGESVPVVAAASGKVIRAYHSSSFGNAVFIRHNVEGQTWVTVYAHLESYSVSSGQSINKGQQLGYIGNTGRSFGAHLHFELHKGDWKGKSSAVNPESYIKF